MSYIADAVMFKEIRSSPGYMVQQSSDPTLKVYIVEGWKMICEDGRSCSLQ